MASMWAMHDHDCVLKSWSLKMEEVTAEMLLMLFKYFVQEIVLSCIICWIQRAPNVWPLDEKNVFYWPKPQIIPPFCDCMQAKSAALAFHRIRSLRKKNDSVDRFNHLNLKFEFEASLKGETWKIVLKLKVERAAHQVSLLGSHMEWMWAALCALGWRFPCSLSKCNNGRGQICAMSG